MRPPAAVVAPRRGVVMTARQGGPRHVRIIIERDPIVKKARTIRACLQDRRKIESIMSSTHNEIVPTEGR